MKQLLSLLVFFSSLSLYSASERPNILIILADDLGYEALGAYGGLEYETPELDAMAAEGVRFDRAYTSPVCTPTRVSLHTGLYTSDHGHTRVLPVHNGTSDVVDFIAMPTFAQLLRESGYRTSVTGKWQLATYDLNPNHISDSGFDSWCIWQIWREDIQQKTVRYWDPYLNEDGVVGERNGSYGPDELADYVAEQMAEAITAEEPFLIVHNMLLPHSPIVTTPDNSTASLGNMINYMDKLVGQILDDVVKLGIRENTYVFFIGDNGTDTEALRETVDGFVSGGKRDLDDGGTRVPFLVWGPSNIGSGRVLDNLVDITDVFPTVCSLAGVAIPESIAYRGHSLEPQLNGRQGIIRRYVHQGIYDIFDQQEREAIFDGEWRLQLDGTLIDGRNPTEESIVSPGDPEGDEVRPRLSFALDYFGNRLSMGSSSVIAEDYFNGYGEDPLNASGLRGGSGWTSSWGSSSEGEADIEYLPSVQLISDTSGYDDSQNLSGTSDGALTFAGDLSGSSIVARGFSTAANTIWFSALISIDESDDRAILWIDSTPDTLNSGDFIGVLDGSIHMRYNGNINHTSAGAPQTGIHLLLGKVELNVDGNKDALTFWFNPDLEGVKNNLIPPTYFDNSADTFGNSLDGIGVLLRDNTDDPTDGEIIDAIRIGSTLESVTIGDVTSDPLSIWRRLEFGPDVVGDSTLEPTLWGDLADPDLDNVPNIYEYYRGTHPLLADGSRIKPDLIVTAEKLKIQQVIRLNDTRNYHYLKVAQDLSLEAWTKLNTVFLEDNRFSLTADFDEVHFSLQISDNLPLFIQEGIEIR